MNNPITCIAVMLFCMTTSCQNTTKEPTTESKIERNESKRIMAIFAHPDDETTIGPVLAKYAAIHDVHIVIATDGRYGTNDHSGIPAGNTLVAIRKEEMQCACEKLGIKAPHYLDAQDGLGLNGHGNFYEQVAQLKKRLQQKIKEVAPDVILTFGADGDTGHPDHRMVGLLTTEILLRESWTKQIDLYYFGWTKEQAKKFPDWNLGYVSKEKLDTRISFNAEEEKKAFLSLQCHKSQYTKKEFADWIITEQKDKDNVLYFRKLILDNKIKDHF